MFLSLRKKKVLKYLYFPLYQNILLSIILQMVLVAKGLGANLLILMQMPALTEMIQTMTVVR